MKETKKTKKNYLDSLQIFRGIAALMVVFHHQWVAFEHFFQAENYILHFLGVLGKYGVDFFFVLSGFIITYSNYNKDGVTKEAKPFIINRILRIYIPFLPVSLLMLLSYNLFPLISEGNRSISILTSLTLIPHGAPALSVSWTLIHEMMFYLLFLSWFISKRFWYCFVFIWVVFIVYLNCFSGNLNWYQKPFLSFFGSFYNLEFIIGFYCAYLYKNGVLLHKGVLRLVGLGLLITAAIFSWKGVQLFDFFENLTFALGFAFIILSSLNTKLDKISSKNILMLLGNASYSIYLVHNTEISILVRVFQKINLPSFPAFIIILILCCVSGIIYSKIFEEYLLSKSKKLLLPSSVPLKASFETSNEDFNGKVNKLEKQY